MGPTAAQAAEAKEQCHTKAKEYAKTVCSNKGISGQMADNMVAGTKAPLLGFTDGFHVHFVGDDADVVAGVLGGEVTVDKDKVRRFAVDTRTWNDANDLLAQHSLTVSITDVPADAE